MNLKYALYPLCTVIFILTVLIFTEDKSENTLSIPYTYSPDHSSYLPTFPNTNLPILRDTSLLWEVIAQHTQSSKGLTAATETLAAGVCVFDANKDGYMDLFVVGGSGFSRHYGKKSWWNTTAGNRLLINQAGQHFVDKTEQSGLQQRQWGTACAIADLDLDGLADIIVTGYGKNVVFKQTDLLKFVDVTRDSGIVSDNWSTGAAIGDYNKDGLPDIYVTNFVQFEKGKRTLEQDTGFTSSVSENFSPSLYDPEPNRLYLNLGNLQFKAVEKSLKVDNSFGRSLVAKWYDFNNDGWLDLIVINSFGSPNQIYLNQTGRRFVPATEYYSTFHLAGSRDMAILQQGQHQETHGKAFFFSRSAGQANVFISKVNSTSLRYSDVARNAKLASNMRMSNENWGVISLDMNNDGLADIYQTSGSLLPDQESQFVTQRQQNNLYMNQGNGHFSAPLTQDKKQPAYSSRAVTSADFNNDGQLELVVANNNGPLQILSNTVESTNSWFGLEMVLDQQSYSPQQAKIEIKFEDKSSIFYDLDYKQSLFAQSDPRMHIGLGDTDTKVDIEITWPDGQIAEFFNIDVNHYYRINKSTSELDKATYSNKKTSDNLVELSKNASQQAIHYLIDIAIIAEDKKALEMIWLGSNSANKIRLLKRISANTNTQNQYWLYAALRDADETVVLAALAIFKQKEWDHSVVYLLPLFEHKNTQVVCAVSDMFAFFFTEEEAVPERKTLAVTPIMRAISLSSSSEKICLLDALAASESKRAVLSVIDTLDKAENHLVQSKAIQTLGLIRDGRANIAIKRSLKTSQSPEVISASLIALKRLSDAEFSNIFEQTFIATRNEPVLFLQLQTLTLLLTDHDSVVINRSLVITALSVLAEFVNGIETSDRVMTSLLQVMGHSRDSRFVNLAKQHLSNKAQRSQAKITLLKIGDPTARIDTEKHMLELTNSALLSLLARLSEQNVMLSSGVITELVNRTILNYIFAESILNLGEKIGRENYQRWLLGFLTQCNDATILISAYHFAIQHDVRGQVKQIGSKWSSNPEVLLQYLKWQYLQSVSFSENQILTLRLMLNQLLWHNQLDNKQKQTLLEIAAKHDAFVANNFLLNNKIGISERQIAAILLEISPLQPSIQQIKLFEHIINNQESPPQDRLIAAAGLLLIKPSRKQEILAKL